MKKGKKQALFLLLLIVLLAAVALLLGGEWLENGREQSQERGDPSVRLKMNGAIEWEGRLYSPRNNVTSLLLYGCSREEATAEQPGGRVTFAQLLVVDHDQKKAVRLPVDPETMTDIQGPDGKMQKGPLADAVAYAQTPEESGTRLTEAVQALLPDGRVDFYLAVEADNMNELLQLAARIAGVVLEEEAPLPKTGGLTSRRLQTQTHSRQMAQLLEMISRMSVASAEEFNHLCDAMTPYVKTDMVRGRMVNELWAVRSFPLPEETALPVTQGTEIGVKEEETRALMRTLFYQLAE